MKVLGIVCLLWLASLAQADTWSFAVLGDTPYSSWERQALPGLLEAIDQSGVRFTAHVGDFKRSNDRCDDALFEDRKALFNQSRLPFIYIPGDNEWTDCDRLQAGSYQPEERLARLRALFWATPASLGQQPLTLTRQSAAIPEHARFVEGSVLFLTLNLPGSDNHWGPGDTPRPEYQTRNPLVLEWLKEGFALARAQQLKGVVVLFQANPAFTHFAKGMGHRGFRAFLQQLQVETLAFPGQVLAIHGDTHWHRIDRPLRDDQGQTIPHFRRVETYGSPFMGWIRIIVDDKDPDLFRFESHPWPKSGL